MPKQFNTPILVKNLKTFYAKRKRMPSYSEMLSIFRYKSKNAVSRAVKHLVAVGVLEKDEYGKILPGRLRKQLKLLGSVAAGFPSPAEEELIDTLSLDEYLIKKPESSYLVTVTGDSMTGAGIHPGDMAIVERGRTARNGDIVIAQVDGEWTMKYYEKKGARVILRSANKKYPPIIPKEEVLVGGIVVASIRKYK